MLRPVFFLLSILLLAVTTATAQHHYTDRERRIITLVDEERGADTVAQFLHDANPDVAWRAAVGLANLRDTSIRPTLIRAFLSEKRDTVMDAEAFALGVLGVSQPAASALLERASIRPSLEILRAIGRTAPSSADACDRFTSKATVKPLQVPLAAMLVEFGLRQHYSESLGRLVDLLGESDFADARWRAAYTLSRLKDSSAILRHLPVLKELLIDQGSEYSRMFAASAIGRIGNAESTRILETALKSELAWRVRINLFNALVRAPKFDSTIFAELRKTVDAATDDNPIGVNLATSGLRSLEQMVITGKLNSQDSAEVGNWIVQYNGLSPEHSDVSKIVQATGLLIAARLRPPDFRSGIANFAQTRDYVLRNLAVEAASLVKDTFYFGGILVSMPVSSPKEQLNRLEALAKLWDLAKQDTGFMAQLERSKISDVYRHLVLYVSEVVTEPEVVIPALNAWSDSTIINSLTVRHQADTLLVNFIRNFTNASHRDQLLAAVSAAIWLRDSTAPLSQALSDASTFAAQTSDKELLDSLQRAYAVLRMPWPGLKPAPRVSDIDWKTLESLPNSLLINFTRDQMEIRVLPYFAPVTTLKMMQLARIQYFANQTFHRVVPNFVVQSGDPTGSGWGGPGYMMRTEIAPIAYDEAGMVGMASSGLNTEGSQWFITECPTPHLSAKYTIWGRVTSGMDKVYRIAPGERLETIMPFTTK